MPHSVRQYNRIKAVAYAHQWAYARNPLYLNFNGMGGDCTNFASQCVFAGSGVMNHTPLYGWYYTSPDDRSPSWTGVSFFYDFMVGNKSFGPFAAVSPVEAMLPGDVVQLSFDGETFGHTPVIVRIDGAPSVDTIYVAAHTIDADNRPLSSYTFKKVRYLHIEGVRT